MWVYNQRNSWHGVDYPYHGTRESEGGIQRLYRRYTEALLAVDESVGRVVTHLEENGLADNTLVLYMGDNGFLWGEHGLIDKRNAYGNYSPPWGGDVVGCVSGEGDVDCLERVVAGVGHGLEIAGDSAVDLDEGGVSEAARHLLLDLGHAEVPLGPVVGEGDRGVVGEAEDVGFVGFEPLPEGDGSGLGDGAPLALCAGWDGREFILGFGLGEDGAVLLANTRNSLSVSMHSSLLATRLALSRSSFFMRRAHLGLTASIMNVMSRRRCAPQSPWEQWS